jgi:hypothetical protein
MRNALLSLAAVALLATGIPSAVAQGMGPQGMGRGPVAAACSTEINTYCAKLSHGGGQVRACLQSHRHELSSGCQKALDNTGYGRRWQ